MTAQISDLVEFRNRPFILAGISGTGLFDPWKLGLQPVPANTACWRGYHCRYSVDGHRLLLTDVNIWFGSEDIAALEAGEGPRIYGMKPERYMVSYQKFDPQALEPVPYTEPSSDFRCSGLQQQMPFDGGLLLADGFIQQLYVHMGFHPAWKYREVWELKFSNGILVSADDRSVAMEILREQRVAQGIEPRPDAGKDEIMEWIRSTFSMDYGW